MVVVCVVVMLLVFGAVEGEVRGWFVDEVFLGYELGECGVLFVGCCGVDEAMFGCSYGLEARCACASIEVRRRLAMTPKALGPGWSSRDPCNTFTSE